MDNFLLSNDWIKFDSKRIDDVFRNEELFNFVITLRRRINYLTEYKKIDDEIIYFYLNNESCYTIYKENLWLIKHVKNFQISGNIEIINKKIISDTKYLKYLIKYHKLLNKRDMKISKILLK